MSRVAQAAQNTTTRVGDTQDASRALATTALQLESLVGRFKLESASISSEQTPTWTRAAAAGA
jgi:hypothetical protein